MVYRRRRAAYSVYRPRRRARRVRPKFPTCAVSVVMSNQHNVTSSATTVQGVLVIHVPGAVQNWRGIAYKLYAGADLRQMVDNAFSGTANLEIVGFTATIKMDNNSCCLIAYKDTVNSPYRVISGLGYVKGNFRFKELPYALMLIGESDTTCKLKFSYKTATIRSAL